MDGSKGEEYYDGGDEEIDIKALNEKAKIQLFENLNSINNETENTQTVSEKKKNKIKEPVSASTSISGENDNPLTKFIQLKSEIDKLEENIKMGIDHKDLLDSDNYYSQLKQLKNTVNYISESDNFLKLRAIIDEQKKSNDANKDYAKLLQKKMCDSLTEHFINRINIITKLKSDNPEEYGNIDYELYITPDTKKIKKLIQINELKQKLKNISKKIGTWDFNEKNKSLTQTIDELKQSMRLFDPEFVKVISLKKDFISKRIQEIQLKGETEEFYDNIDEEYLNALYCGYKNGNEVGEIIVNTINELEKMKDEHEKGAYINLKLKELIDQQDKLGIEINCSYEILINLKKNIKNNVEVMKKNIELLKSRINNKK